MIKEDIKKIILIKILILQYKKNHLGIAHALTSVKNLIENYSKILFILGDNFFGENPIIENSKIKKLNSCFFLKKVE